jgi:energy-coupling factor transport system permease protein
MRPLYSFSAGNSPLHRLDARTKLIIVLTYLVLALVLPQPWILFLLLIVLTWVFAQISPAQYFPFLLLMAPIIIAIMLVHSFLIGGPPYLFEFHLGFLPIHLSAPGLENGATLAFRLGTMGLAFTIFSMTTEPFVLGMALYRWGLNYKVAFMFAFALRFFPLFQEELIVVQNALKARGSDELANLSPLRPYGFFHGMAIATVPMALGAVRRSQEIALSMEMRGLNLPDEEGIKRTLYRHIEFRPVDIALIGLCLLVLIAAVGWRIATTFGYL